MRDPYEVLGVSKTASEAEIKKAFRNLAKKHHPDTHSGDAGAKKRFQEISAAYDIVGDKDKRGKFDRGEIDAGGNPRGFDPRQGGAAGGPFRGNPRDFNFNWTGGDAAEEVHAEDIFSELFGGRGRRGQPFERVGRDRDLVLANPTHADLRKVVASGAEGDRVGDVAGLQGAGDVGPVGVLGEVAARARLQRLDDRAVVGVGGEHDDRDPGMLGDEAAGGADAVEHGHVQVEQDRVGLVLGHQGQGLLAVGGGADHVDAGQPAQQQDQALADAGLVVGDGDGRAGRLSPAFQGVDGPACRPGHDG